MRADFHAYSFAHCLRISCINLQMFGTLSKEIYVLLAKCFFENQLINLRPKINKNWIDLMNFSKLDGFRGKFIEEKSIRISVREFLNLAIKRIVVRLAAYDKGNVLCCAFVDFWFCALLFFFFSLFYSVSVRSFFVLREKCRDYSRNSDVLFHFLARKVNLFEICAFSSSFSFFHFFQVFSTSKNELACLRRTIIASSKGTGFGRLLWQIRTTAGNHGQRRICFCGKLYFFIHFTKLDFIFCWFRNFTIAEMPRTPSII